MSLNPQITRDSSGVLWLSVHPDEPIDGYRVYDSRGMAIAKTFDPNHATKLGKLATWTGGAAALHLTEGTREHVEYPAAPPPPPPPPPVPTGHALPRVGISCGYKIGTFPDSLRNQMYDKFLSLGARYHRFDVMNASNSQADLYWPYLSARGLKALPIIYGDSDKLEVAGLSPTLAYDFAVKWKGKIDCCEILNEPDWGKDWTATEYAQFAKAKIADFKRGNPDAYCAAGAFWKTSTDSPTGTRDWVAALISAQVGMDAVSLHLYDDPLTRGAWNLWDMAYPWPGGAYNGQTIREMLDANGLQHVDIISTEGGGPVPKYSLDKQAAIIGNNIGQVEAGKIYSSAIYTLPDQEVTGFGMLNPDFTERPACGVYRTAAARVLP